MAIVMERIMRTTMRSLEAKNLKAMWEALKLLKIETLTSRRKPIKA